MDHYNIQPTYDIYADVDQTDLGGVANKIHDIIHQEQKLPRGHRA